jgi:hypothetical protein
MTHKTDAIAQGLYEEMITAEAAVLDADKVLDDALDRFEVTTRKYSAIRDALAKYAGCNPYSKQFLKQVKPLDSTWGKIVSGKTFGSYRFINIPIGNAVIIALQEMQEPLTLEQIVKRLHSGGIQKSEKDLVRPVNAALMRTKGIVKTEEGKYKLLPSLI